MAEQDLDWDHSIGENLMQNDEFDDILESSPNSQFYDGPPSQLNTTLEENNRTRAVQLSHRQLAYLLRTLNEASSLLQEQQNLEQASFLSRAAPQSSTTIANSKKFSRCRQKIFACRFWDLAMKWSLLITLIIQTLILICVTIIDSSQASNKHHRNMTNTSDVNYYEQASYSVMFTLNALSLALLIYISVRVTRELLLDNASTRMLAQAYLSTVVVFAGLYVLTYRVRKDSWTLHGFNVKKDEVDDGILVSYLYLKMLYHSISTSTLSGASTIHPDAWFNFILMSIQMLLSFVYYTSILGQTIGSFSGSRHIRPKNHISSTKTDKMQNGVRRRRFSTGSFVSRESLPNESTRLVNESRSDAVRYDGL